MKNETLMVKSIATKRKKLTNVEASYLAGFIDGEGGLYLSKFRKGENFVYEVCVRITNTDPYVITLCNKYGGCWQGQEQTKKWKIVYRWILGKDDARFYLPQLLPYLHIKKKQARIILKSLDCLHGSGHPQDKEELAFFRKELDVLNRRGPKAKKYE